MDSESLGTEAQGSRRGAQSLQLPGPESRRPGRNAGAGALARAGEGARGRRRERANGERSEEQEGTQGRGDWGAARGGRETRLHLPAQNGVPAARKPTARFYSLSSRNKKVAIY